MAPRAGFIGGGALLTDPVYVPGDAWQDAQVCFMAAAGGESGLGVAGCEGLWHKQVSADGDIYRFWRVAFRRPGKDSNLGPID